MVGKSRLGNSRVEPKKKKIDLERETKVCM